MADLRRRIRAADAVLIATPEYNSSIPGVLKNALDWLSRPAQGHDPVLALKPVAVIGASPSPQPEFLLFHAHQQFASDGSLTDGSPAHQLLGSVLHALVELTEQTRRQAAARVG